MKSLKIILFFSAFITCTAILFYLIPAPAVAVQSNIEQKQEDVLKKFNAIPFDFSQLRTGDLIVRSGRSFFSDELRKYNLREDKYSHCGWVSLDSTGKIYIYHAIGGSDNPENKVRKDLLPVFLSPRDIYGFAVYRYQLDQEQIAKGDLKAKEYFQREAEFDMDFDLQNDEKIYCAEYIYNIVMSATNNEKYISLSQMNGKVYAGIDDLYLNPKTKKIFEYEYPESSN